MHRPRRLPLRMLLDRGVLFLGKGTPIRDDLRVLRNEVRCP